jgi:thymidylate synthase ThyX
MSNLETATAENNASTPSSGAEEIGQLPNHARNNTEVFAVHGADPEVLAYAMAKYSRSSLSMRQSLKEISSQRAEQFLNTFYFQYGHRSIADLAHVAFAVERLSLLAAIILVDEQRWDGQERSTRYQNFLQSGWYLPDFGADNATRELFSQTVEGLFTTYDQVSVAVLEALKQRVPCPETMKVDAWERTLKARAFDVARFLLPLATNTSLGQIVNARTLESQVSRLLSHPAAEIRDLGEKLREAATGPAWNLHAEESRGLHAKIAAVNPQLGAESEALLTREIHASPTLVKYAHPNEYELKTRSALKQVAAEILSGVPIAEAPLVDLVEKTESLEVELAATLIYSVSHHPYRQIRNLLQGSSAARVAEVIELGLEHRGRHDEMSRAFHAGQELRFDILMDIGGFRDMHRHRRCTQILQDFTSLHGYDIPETGDAAGLAEAGMIETYRTAVETALAASTTVAASTAHEAAESAVYLLPLATRIRSLFKMDFAEAAYISELRSGPAGHFSYRKVAWEMYLAVKRQHPTLARYFRVTDFAKPIDLLKR